MGGFGSGLWQCGKDTTSDLRALDIRKLQRDGLLTPGRAFNWRWTINGKETAFIQIRTEVDRVILDYRIRSNGGKWQPLEYPVYLVWTGLHFGGRRAWFLCPAQRMRAACGDSFLRFDLRLSALSPFGLCVPTGIGR